MLQRKGRHFTRIPLKNTLKRLVVANCWWNVKLGICPGGATPPLVQNTRAAAAGSVAEGMHALVQLVVFWPTD